MVATDTGTITIGCPKLWVSDRIFTVLDGLLRDVDSINLKSLQGLDPNSITGGELLSIVNEFQANLKYDQGAAVGNAFKLQKANAQRAADMQQFKTRQDTNKSILEREQLLQQRALSLQEQEYGLIGVGKDDQDPDLKKVRAEETLVSTQLTSLKAMETTPAIQDQTVSSSDTTQAGAATATTSALDAEALKNAFGNILQNPKLPATMQMDNVIELLKQRLAREFGVMYDDLSRQSGDYNLYLAQFDIGLLPGRDGKKQQPRVIIQFTNNQILAYDLFPAGAAYNTAVGQAKTTKIGISGAAQTLFGFGLSAAFNHSRNQLRSSLTQMMYVSAFGAGTPQFGWTFGTAPFEDFISPGNRSVYAILLVPKNLDQSQIDVKVTTCWVKEGRGRSSDCTQASDEPSFNFSLPESVDAGNPKQNLLVISYQPYNEKNVPSGATSSGQNLAPQPTSNTVQLIFSSPIDPNMTITVGDKILRRVRDVRGRALYGTSSDSSVLAGNQAERDALSKSRFGLLESDTLEDDTWFQVNSRTVLLNVSRKTAGTDLFPVIRISDPRSGGRDVFSMVKHGNTDVRIGEWEFTSETVGNLTAAFPPLFTEPYDAGRIHVYVDDVSSDSSYPTKLRIVSNTRLEGRTRPVWLHEQAQVVLQAEQGGSPDWALTCFGDEGTLLCDMPADQEYITITKTGSTNLKVWIDQPPYFGRPGLWANDELVHPNKWAKQPYAATDWSDVREICSSETTCPDAWSARIKVKNLEEKQYCLSGLPNTKSLNDRINALQEGRSKDSKEAQKQELKLLQQMVASSGAAGLQNDKVGEVGGCPDVAVTMRRMGDYLSLDIPFNRFPYVLDRITLERLNCDRNTSACNSIILPELRSHLMPGPVTLTDLKQGDYRLQGTRLRAVQKIRLSRGGAAVDYGATVGIDNVDFSLSTRKEKLNAGTYNIFFLIGQIQVPAVYEDDQKKLRQLVLVIPPTDVKIDKADSRNNSGTKLVKPNENTNANSNKSTFNKDNDNAKEQPAPTK
jgi:hypothetical protein